MEEACTTLIGVIIRYAAIIQLVYDLENTTIELIWNLQKYGIIIVQGNGSYYKDFTSHAN